MRATYDPSGDWALVYAALKLAFLLSGTMLTGNKVKRFPFFDVLCMDERDAVERGFATALRSRQSTELGSRNMDMRNLPGPRHLTSTGQGRNNEIMGSATFEQVINTSSVGQQPLKPA